ncbi:eCIS core domain-containing protein, partial [Streptomyces venezuelae]|uniref:eCIS core domain-containing protein n=1 Tax=Streptomyces venezuelae TaxID=54571 RepID=UPI00278BE69F
MSPRQAGDLQRRIGNAAVSRLVHRERQEPSGGHAEHEHPAGGHAHEHPSGGQDSAPVQRSTVHQVLRGSGRPLGEALKSEMESRLGADFSDVRLHTGPAARRSAAEIGARAYTSGSHVVIGTGGADKHTLAHELTHVIQQRHGPVSGTDNGAGLSLSDPSDRFEREAEANAARVMARRPAAGPGPA